MRQNYKVKISLYISIIGLLFLVVGSSFALLQDSQTSSKNQIIQTGAVKLRMTENKQGIVFDNLQSLSDLEGMDLEEYYDFEIANIGDANAEYTISLVDDSTVASSLDISFLRIGLEMDNGDIKTFNLQEANRVIDEGVIRKGEILSYKLRIWIDEDAVNSSDTMISENDNISLKLKVDAVQFVGEAGAITFNYTGDYQEFVAFESGYYSIEAYGAQGAQYNSTYYGGKGGYTKGTIYLNEGEKLYIYVGGAGNLSDYGTNKVSKGGYNGGGDGYTASSAYSGGGGGATDIRYFGSVTPTEEELVWNSTLGLNSRIMVAAGGGGSYWYSSSYYGKGGYGGGLVGADGYGYYSGTTYAAAGGTQISSSFGQGASTPTTIATPGGGGGYYGGANKANYSAAGGSSFISGYAGVNAITSSTDRTHTNNTLHYSGKYFIDGKIKADNNVGNGKVAIEFLGSNSPHKTNSKLNNVRYIKDCTSGNSSTSYNIWNELQAIYQGVNVAKGITATGFTADSENPMSYITDGNITYGEYAEGSPYNGTQCITIDLGNNYDLDEIVVWHYPNGGRTYTDHIMSVSSDNVTWTEVINEDYEEDNLGKRVNAYK